MARFENPNDPAQPQPGVYGWFFTADRRSVCLYIGEAGKQRSAKDKGTLLRGVTELFREYLSSDSPGYRRLDTDFVVGTAIRYFERIGHDVYWKHLDNDPARELDWLARLRPLLQRPDRPHLLPELKILSDVDGYWRWPGNDLDQCRRKLGEADSRVAEVVARLWHDVNDNQ